jgi:hypothetical protein
MYTSFPSGHNYVVRMKCTSHAGAFLWLDGPGLLIGQLGLICGFTLPSTLAKRYVQELATLHALRP